MFKFKQVKKVKMLMINNIKYLDCIMVVMMIMIRCIVAY